MSRISDLDKVLVDVRHLSKDLAPIQGTELSMTVGIEIDLLDEYLEELKNRGYITYNKNGSYITLQGRMALENAKNGKPFQEEIDNNRIKKVWSIIKIIAAAMNALAIIIIAIWAHLSPNEKTDLENEVRLLKQEQKNEQIKHSNQIDSLKTIIEKSYHTQYPDATKKSMIKNK